MLEIAILEIEKYIGEYNRASLDDGDFHSYKPFSQWDFDPIDLRPSSSVTTFLLTKMKKLNELIAADDSALSLTSPYSYIRDCKAYINANKNRIKKDNLT